MSKKSFFKKYSDKILYECSLKKNMYLKEKTFPLVILLYFFAHFVPNWNLNFRLSLHFIVFNIGQRAAFNEKDFLVGDI